MEEREDKELDALIRTMLKKTELSKPSADFTQNIMREVHVLAEAKKHKTTSLIPKPVWGILLAAYALILIFFFKSDILSREGWFTELGERTTSLFNLQIPSLELSNTLVYGALCATIMVLVQVLMLRRREV